MYTDEQIDKLYDQGNEGTRGFSAGSEGDTPQDAAVAEGWDVIRTWDSSAALSMHVIARRPDDHVIAIVDIYGPWAVDITAEEERNIFNYLVWRLTQSDDEDAEDEGEAGEDAVSESGSETAGDAVGSSSSSVPVAAVAAAAAVAADVAAATPGCGASSSARRASGGGWRSRRLTATCTRAPSAGRRHTPADTSAKPPLPTRRPSVSCPAGSTSAASSSRCSGGSPQLPAPGWEGRRVFVVRGEVIGHGGRALARTFAGRPECMHRAIRDRAARHRAGQEKSRWHRPGPRQIGRATRDHASRAHRCGC